MELLSFPASALFQKCVEVSRFDSNLKNTLDQMWEIMLANKGVGLSCNQVGLFHRAFVMSGPDNEKLYIVNPKILKKSQSPANLSEGCLSAKGEFLVLPERAMWVHLLYQDENGDVHSGIFRGIHSVCCLHELGHLDGESFMESKSIPRAKRRELAKKWGLQ